MTLFRKPQQLVVVRRLDYSAPDAERALVSTYAAIVCFVVAGFAPCFTIYPKFGGGWPERIAKWLDPGAVEPQTFSLLGGIGHLFHGGDFFIGSVLLLFSVLFPAAKLLTTLYLAQAEPRHGTKFVGALANLGKWSMLDVFVVAGIVISFKAFPLGTRIEPRWGIGLFAVSVILGMIGVHFLKRTFMPKTDDRTNSKGRL